MGKEILEHIETIVKELDSHDIFQCLPNTVYCLQEIKDILEKENDNVR